jgi:hypothetical protein
MERVIAKALNLYLEDNSILSDHQYGFRSGHSPVEQLILTYNDVSHWFDMGSCVNLILFDFSRAFDRVNHGVLLEKLGCIGIGGSLLQWIANFLVGRKMAVRISGACSALGGVSSGVPQGSVLGPLLFLLFINHLVHDLDCYFKIFADDLKIYFASDSPYSLNLQNSVDTLHSRASDWGLLFNAEKCANLRFQRGSSPNMDDLFNIDGVPIRCAESHSDLGVTVDSHLKFHRHHKHNTKI